ncbi:uncharacterized protein CIMG_00283 [Coccidioides immitis RS]|uniref:Uncharacterized protein n=1 Tax=Coccidioides immitis (strain RS) TaxID=246410 RepID=A0A0E1S4C2_COCIM|nr:uncharacterized protein CIMG_00283 [Coccidioides immitis RS]EAS34929.2 hypothetical protein CIMG_00283 [Coccidioides immitis RS]
MRSGLKKLDQQRTLGTIYIPHPTDPDEPVKPIRYRTGSMVSQSRAIHSQRTRYAVFSLKYAYGTVLSRSPAPEIDTFPCRKCWIFAFAEQLKSLYMFSIHDNLLETFVREQIARERKSRIRSTFHVLLSILDFGFCIPGFGLWVCFYPLQPSLNMHSAGADVYLSLTRAF